METPEELIEKCKAHLRDSTTPQQWFKTDIRKLITALERALSTANVVGQSEQLVCPECNGANIETDKSDIPHWCKECGAEWVK